MPRMNILNTVEREAFNSPPVFSRPAPVYCRRSYLGFHATHYFWDSFAILECHLVGHRNGRRISTRGLQAQMNSIAHPSSATENLMTSPHSSQSSFRLSTRTTCFVPSGCS